MTKIRMTTTADIDMGGHFVGHFGYHMSDKTVFELEREVDRSNPYMKFGRNPIKND